MLVTIHDSDVMNVHSYFKYLGGHFYVTKKYDKQQIRYENEGERKAAPESQGGLKPGPLQSVINAVNPKVKENPINVHTKTKCHSKIVQNIIMTNNWLGTDTVVPVCVR